MFEWLKRLMGGSKEIADPQVEPSIEPTQDECIKEARELLMEAVEILDWSGLSYFEIKDIVCDVVDEYDDAIDGWDGDDGEDSWFPGKEYGDDDCDCPIDCECPDCSDADEDFIGWDDHNGTYGAEHS